MKRRDLLKGMATGVAAALLPASHTPRLTQAAAPGLGTVAAVKEAVPEPKLEMGVAEYFSPMVIESRVEQQNDVIELGLGEFRSIPAMTRIHGSFSMYVDGADQADNIHKVMSEQSTLNLELAQGPFNYRFKAHITGVTITASAHEMMIADVDFIASQMEVVEA